MRGGRAASADALWGSRCPPLHGRWVPVSPRGAHARRAGCLPGRSEQRSRASVSPVCSAKRGGTPRAMRGRRGPRTHPRPGAAADLLPSTPGLPTAARPSRRHVLSREECAKSLPDVRGGQPATPLRGPPGWPPGTGDPTPPRRRAARGAEPVTGRILPGHRAQPQPVPWRRGAEVRRSTGRTAGCRGADGRCHWGRAASPVSPSCRGPAALARQGGPGVGAVGSCGVLPRTPGPGARQERSRAERGCQMESGCRR